MATENESVRKLDPFPNKPPVCPKCGGKMTARRYAGTSCPYCNETAEHLHWHCVCPYAGPVTACKDAKTRYFTSVDERVAFGKLRPDGWVEWVNRNRSVTTSRNWSKDVFEDDVRRGIRRELTEAEAVALLTPKRDPFKPFEDLVRDMRNAAAGCTDRCEHSRGVNRTIVTWSTRLDALIAEARKAFH